MKRGRSAVQLISRIGLWSLLLGSTALFLLVSLALDDYADLRRATTCMLEGQPARASLLFERLEHSPWVGGESRMGSRIAQALQGKSSSDPVVTEEVDSGRFPLKLLLFNELRRNNHQGCLRLSQFLGKLGFEEATLFESASLLELGRTAESARIYRSLPAGARKSWLGSRLGVVHSVLEKGSRALVQDRRGQPLGWVTSSGSISYLEHVRSELIPTAAIEAGLQEDLTRNVRLSIDIALTEMASRALGRYRGSIVLMIPDTGEILAAVSDRRSMRKGALPALEQAIEPASIAKLITTTAALRAGIDPDSEISKMKCRGAARYGGHFLYCAYRAGRLHGLTEAMAISCNIAFANLGAQLSPGRLLEEFRRFGFSRGEQEGIPYGRILVAQPNPRQLADFAIGLENTSITPVHAAALAAVFANQGILPVPTLISSTDGLLGIGEYPRPAPQGQPVVEPDWVPIVVDSMKAVAMPGGTASGVAPKGFPVAMKTGTAATPGLGYHTNYIGFGPLQNPSVAFCVRITNQRSSKEVRWATRMVTRSLLRALGRNQHYLDEPEVEPEDWTRTLVASQGTEASSGQVSAR